MSEETPAQPPSDFPPPPPPPPPPAPPPPEASPPAAPPGYAPPPLGTGPSVGRRRGLSTGAIVSIVVIALLVVGAFGAYAVTGLAVASNRISTANSAINRAVSHQADFE